jgi:hypothetical protein
MAESPAHQAKGLIRAPARNLNESARGLTNRVLTVTAARPQPLWRRRATAPINPYCGVPAHKSSNDATCGALVAELDR